MEGKYTMLDRLTARAAVAAIVAGLAALACTDSPISPEPSLNSLGDDDGTITMPMQVDATIMWIVDTEGFPPECEGTPGLAEGFGSGEATHLGRFDITMLDHCSIDVAGFLADTQGLSPEDPAFFAALVEHARREGAFTLTAADGSTLSGSYAQFLFTSEPGGTEFADGATWTMTITGGTDRFEGATGELEADLERSTFPFSDDPLFLEKTTFPVVLEGEVTLTRP